MVELLTLAYKGSRDYLHGSDIFNAVSGIADEITGSSRCFVDRLIFRRYARTMCALTTVKPNNLEKIVGQVRYMIPDDKRHVDCWLVEKDKLVTNRNPFDETFILSDVDIDKKRRSVILHERSIYTPIEDILVLTKYLNYTISPLRHGNWLFGQLDLVSPLNDDYQSLEIQMKNLIEGRFSVNSILIGGCQIGKIRFIMGT